MSAMSSASWRPAKSQVPCFWQQDAQNPPNQVTGNKIPTNTWTEQVVQKLAQEKGLSAVVIRKGPHSITYQQHCARHITIYFQTPGSTQTWAGHIYTNQQDTQVTGFKAYQDNSAVGWPPVKLQPSIRARQQNAALSTPAAFQSHPTPSHSSPSGLQPRTTTRANPPSTNSQSTRSKNESSSNPYDVLSNLPEVDAAKEGSLDVVTAHIHVDDFDTMIIGPYEEWPETASRGWPPVKTCRPLRGRQLKQQRTITHSTTTTISTSSQSATSIVTSATQTVQTTLATSSASKQPPQHNQQT
ncbi:hypothetical protein EJ08DRAFT_665303 [Tothia fuscella]|uniref:Uncharacterized protein n=1 Tax=Tothia fuscella TaxID=1048955 RepID=A0A9P4TU30_9PEZI|nr:hypothetical protein EJ08DRAFT_665303 [Tothia fuscella]